MGRGDLTDAEWERLRPFVPVSNRRCGRWRGWSFWSSVRRNSRIAEAEGASSYDKAEVSSGDNEESFPAGGRRVRPPAAM
ncbi:hypothetical protein [Streptomyces sp. PvR006]|uniref:hypothetical protein n=1 Tax=Streptomyces sp. PvR006 TaxID=2817860 RepID=UPI001AE2AF85|nr:hypothetical protein [Streptomyces sp. PvR006]